jgi:uncharacterized SAM-dependent methyltransferase
MSALLQAHIPSLASEASPLEIAAIALFRRQKQGHLDPFQYSTPDYPGDVVDGARLWSEFLKRNPAYTIPAEEMALIRLAVPLLSRFKGEFDQFIDLGPGSIEAFRSKTAPLLAGLGPKTYRPIDSCTRFLAEIETVMRLENRDIPVQALCKNFLLDPLVPAEGASWIFWGGGGFSNIGTDTSDEIPVVPIRERMSLLIDLLSAGGKCLITFDTCRDAKRLVAAYNHPYFAQFNLNVLHRIRRDCPSIVFDPFAWRYLAVWNPETFALEHHLVATRAQEIHLSRETISVLAGESFIVDNSFKFPIDIVSKIAASAGWRDPRTLGSDGHTQLLLLSA